MSRTLAERIAPFEDAKNENYRRIGEIACWLRANPHVHPDVRKQKLRAWRLLEQECLALDAQLERTWEAWLADRQAEARRLELVQ